MAEDVIVGRGMVSRRMISSRSFQSSSKGIFLLQILLTVPHQLLGIRVIRGQGQPVLRILIGGGSGRYAIRQE